MRRRKKEPAAFTKIISALMKERGLTIAEAARIAGVPQSTLGDWKSGTRPDDFVAVKRLAEHFGVSLAFLLTGEDDRKSDKGVPPLSAVFDDGGILFDGFAKITIQRLMPRQSKRGGGKV